MANAALLLIAGEPLTPGHKDLILAEITKGFRGWDEEASGVDINSELARISDRASAGKDGPEGVVPVVVTSTFAILTYTITGEKIIHHTSPAILVEILLNPTSQTVKKSLKDFLTTSVSYRHLIFAGHSFQGNGAWLLQDDTFPFSRFAQVFKDPEVEAALKQKDSILNVHCIGEGDWLPETVQKLELCKLVKLCVNPEEKLSDVTGAVRFSGYISSLDLDSKHVTSLLPASDIVGNIRFNKPTIYIFPGCEGDSCLFGISGFNLLVNGGYNRRSCFWDFTCHLDRLDAILLTHLGTDNIFGISSALERKSLENVYPEVGYIYLNAGTKAKHSPDAEDSSADVGKKADLLVNLSEEGNCILEYSRQLGHIPNPCTRSASPELQPINLYHKVGHGSLDMYILSPSKDAKEMKAFFDNWNKMSSNFGSENGIPNENLLSVATLVVWKPDNPTENITRILFPGNSPQARIFEGIEKLKSFDYLNHPVCCSRSLPKPKTMTPPPEAPPATRPTSIKTARTTDRSKAPLSTRSPRKPTVPPAKAEETKRTVTEKRKPPEKPISERRKPMSASSKSSEGAASKSSDAKSPEANKKPRSAPDIQKVKSPRAATADAGKVKSAKDSTKTTTVKKAVKTDKKSPEPLPSPEIVANSIEPISTEVKVETVQQSNENHIQNGIKVEEEQTEVKTQIEVLPVSLSDGDLKPQNLPDPVCLPTENFHAYDETIEHSEESKVDTIVDNESSAENATVTQVTCPTESIHEDVTPVPDEEIKKDIPIEPTQEVSAPETTVSDELDVKAAETIVDDTADVNSSPLEQDAVTLDEKPNEPVDALLPTEPVTFQQETEDQPVSDTAIEKEDDREEYENDYSSQMQDRDSPLSERVPDIVPDVQQAEVPVEEESESIPSDVVENLIDIGEVEKAVDENLMADDVKDEKTESENQSEPVETESELNELDVVNESDQNQCEQEADDTGICTDSSADKIPDDLEGSNVDESPLVSESTNTEAEQGIGYQQLSNSDNVPRDESFEHLTSDDPTSCHGFSDVPECDEIARDSLEREAEAEELVEDSFEGEGESEELARDSLEREVESEELMKEQKDVDECEVIENSINEDSLSDAVAENHQITSSYEQSERAEPKEEERQFKVEASNELQEDRLQKAVSSEHQDQESEIEVANEPHELEQQSEIEISSDLQEQQGEVEVQSELQEDTHQSQIEISTELQEQEKESEVSSETQDEQIDLLHEPHKIISTDQPEIEISHEAEQENLATTYKKPEQPIPYYEPAQTLTDADDHTDDLMDPDHDLYDEESGSTLPEAFEKDITPDPGARPEPKDDLVDVHTDQNGYAGEMVYPAEVLKDNHVLDTCNGNIQHSEDLNNDGLPPGLCHVNPYYSVNQQYTEDHSEDQSEAQGDNKTISGNVESVDSENDDQMSFNPLKEWGEPMALPQPINTSGDAPAKAATGTTKRTTKTSTFDRLSTAKTRPTSAKAETTTTTKTSRVTTTTTTSRRPASARPASATTKTTKAVAKTNGVASPHPSPIYVDLSYIPAHGDPAYSDVEFFKTIRARYYVLSTLSPNPKTLTALLDAKKTWENTALEVTVIPTYESEILRHWMALNLDQLNELKIDVVPAASRCTIQLQDHDTNCLAYRLEF